MQFFIQNQCHRLPQYLSVLKAAPLSYNEPLNLPCDVERLAVRSNPRCDLRSCNIQFLFRYDVYPPNLLNFFGEWQLDGRELEMGDTIVQQAQFPPCRAGIKILFGSRVLAAYRTETTAGFGYGTLAGHPETGTKEFAFTAEGDSLFALVRTIAVPVIRFAPRALVQRYVRFCNRQALHRMRDNFLRYNRTECEGG